MIWLLAAVVGRCTTSPSCDPQPLSPKVAGRDVFFARDIGEVHCVVRVDGDLHLHLDGPVDLPDLEAVTGDVFVFGATTTLELPRLRSVDGFTASGIPTLQSIRLPALTSAGELYITKAPQLADFWTVTTTAARRRGRRPGWPQHWCSKPLSRMRPSLPPLPRWLLPLRPTSAEGWPTASRSTGLR